MMQLSPEKQLIELIERGRIKKAKRLLKSNAPWPPCSLTEAFCAAAKRRNQRTISLLIVWGAVYLIARSAFLPDITFDQERRAMIIGRGNAAQQIPYADIARVEVAPVQDRIGGLAVYVVQHNGEQIKLGAITKASMDESADGIVRLIARETGAQMQPPVAEEA